MVESGAIRGRPQREQLDAFLRDTSEPLTDAELDRVPVRPSKWTAPLLGECVLGIDPSLTGFAICYSVPGRELVEGEWKTKPSETVRGRMERIDALIRGTLDVVRVQKPGLILIEGYSMGSKGGMAFDRTELGGVLRWKLCELTQCPIIEPAPKSLKKFTTGSGAGTKDEMVSVLARKHDRSFKTNNQADAFALCQLGLALTGQLAPSRDKAERAYLAKLAKSYGLPAPA